MGANVRIAIATAICAGTAALTGACSARDGLVTEQLVDNLFHPERLAAILASLTARRAEKAESVNSRIMALQREATDAENRLKRLYRLIEDGLTDLDDVLSDRLNTLKADRDRAMAALDNETTKSQVGAAIPYGQKTETAGEPVAHSASKVYRRDRFGTTCSPASSATASIFSSQRAESEGGVEPWACDHAASW
jgi:hypothetical protein